MPEDQNREWQARWRDEYPKWICGFANAQGGIEKVMQACREHGIQPPDLRYESPGLWVEFTHAGPEVETSLDYSCAS